MHLLFAEETVYGDQGSIGMRLSLSQGVTTNLAWSLEVCLCYQRCLL